MANQFWLVISIAALTVLMVIYFIGLWKKYSLEKRNELIQNFVPGLYKEARNGNIIAAILFVIIVGSAVSLISLNLIALFH